MIRTLTLFLLFLIAPFCLPAQANLLPSINTPGLPPDSAFIAPYNFYIDTSDLFVQSGFHTGDILPDFTLYDTASQPYTLSSVLSDGKPVLLVSISLTCPASRSSMFYVLPDLVALYGNDVNFILVYTLDAHPVYPDLCPYSGNVNTLQINFQDSILFLQARRYYHRKQMATRFINQFSPAANVLVDGPGNEYWNNFGPAPNNAYLIAPNGMVFSKYGWFGRSKIQLLQDIPILLNTVGVNENTADKSISLYPNPSDGTTTIRVNESGPWSFYVRDLSGKLLFSKENINSNSASLSEAELASGLYLVEIVTPEERRQLRFVRN